MASDSRSVASSICRTACSSLSVASAGLSVASSSCRAATSPDRPRAIALDDSAAYWVTKTCALNAVSPSGGPTRALAGDGPCGELPVGAIVLDEHYAYWICGRTIRRVSKAGGASTTIYQDDEPEQILMGIAASDDSVFAAGIRPALVVRVPKH